MANSDLGFPKPKTSRTLAAAADVPISEGGSLNEDTLTKILLLLPVPSLLRLQVVAKSWLSLITNPNFISQHLDHSKAKENPRSLILSVGNKYLRTGGFCITREYLKDPEVRDIFYFYSPNSTTGEEEGEMRDISVPYNFLNRSPSIEGDSSSLILNGVLNGIVCATNICDYPDSDTDHSIFLWNPATFRSKELPKPNIHHQASSMDFSIGFGYESNSEDYKVVRIVKGTGYRGRVRAEVYSAKEISWKEVKIELRYFDKCRKIECFACLDGILYWSNYNEMITFDLRKEEFDRYTIELPNSTFIGTSCVTEMTLGEFMGSVALFERIVSCPGDASKINQVSLWTLDDPTGNAIWTRKSTFNVSPTLEKCFSLRNRNIVGVNDGGSLVFYDLLNKREEVQQLPVPTTLIRQVYSYSESLVTIAGAEPVKHTFADASVDQTH